jgi:hypothetical protein
MAPDLKQVNAEILIVAAPNWLSRIADTLALSSPAHCPTVFEAVAQAALNQKKEVSSILLILIDPLNELEMEAFKTLTSLSRTTTWALSTLNQPNQKKFQAARTHNIAGCAILKEHCPQLTHLIESLQPKPKSNAPTEPVIHKRLPPDPTNETIEKENEQLEPLTDAELEALLGPAEPDTF